MAEESSNNDHEPQDPPLLLAAQDAAEAQVRFWIRSVLRETALQAVRIQWKLVVTTPPAATAATENGTSSRTTAAVQIHLDHSSNPDIIAHAQQVCRTVAQKWSENLQ